MWRTHKPNLAMSAAFTPVTFSAYASVNSAARAFSSGQPYA